LRIWLHEAVGDETGWSAWCLDLLGFATWAPTETGVLARVPAKLDEHQEWLARHGVPTADVDRAVRVVERVHGDEVLFSRDAEPCEVDEIDLAIRLLTASREDLIETVSSLPPDALDWEPPYRSFAAWATWKTVRATLAHIANTETRYYLPSVGHEPRLPPAPVDGGWREFLPEHREEATRFLRGMHDAADRARVSQDGDWSLRKVLRRLVRHELLHWKSIRRIAGEYTAG
jgi:hypothetical protein